MSEQNTDARSLAIQNGTESIMWFLYLNTEEKYSLTRKEMISVTSSERYANGTV